MYNFLHIFDEKVDLVVRLKGNGPVNIRHQKKQQNKKSSSRLPGDDTENAIVQPLKYEICMYNKWYII